MKITIVAILGFLAGLTYSNFGSKLFSPEANAKVKAVQEYKLNTTVLE